VRKIIHDGATLLKVKRSPFTNPDAVRRSQRNVDRTMVLDETLWEEVWSGELESYVWCNREANRVRAEPPSGATNLSFDSGHLQNPN
jgi:hypothetical protein